MLEALNVTFGKKKLSAMKTLNHMTIGWKVDILRPGMPQ